MHALTSVEREAAQVWFVQREAEIAAARDTYSWPPGTSTDEALLRRDQLADQVRVALAQRGCLAGAVWRAVLEWGFNGDSSVLDGLSEDDLQSTSRTAFQHLDAGDVGLAARALIGLPGIGIARASKLLALSDQDRVGIFDSRVGRALASLVSAGRPLLDVPPGRTTAGSTTDSRRLCASFERFVELLDLWRAQAAAHGSGRVLQRAADIEMGLFMLSGSA